MSKSSWGKPRILVKDLDTVGATWEEMPTPVEDSTSLETTEGDKLEAKIEGGENEDVKYKKNNFALSYDIRTLKGRNLVIEDNDGVVDHNYALAVIPEDPTCAGLYFDKTSASVVKSYTAAEGIKRTYKHSALVPDDGSHQMKVGVITVTEAGGVISNVSVAEESKNINTLSASPASLSFVANPSAASTTTISGASSIVSARGNRSWMTVTFNGMVVSVTAAQNTNSSSRSGSVTVVAGDDTIVIPVTQAGASA